jgi:chaperonin GroEL
MAKQVIFEEAAREAIKRGVTKITSAVRQTIGPKGKHIILDKSWGVPVVTKDGASITDEIELEDPNENMGAQMIKESAKKTEDDAGDGTTTSSIFASTIFNEGYKLVTAGANPMAISRGIKMAAEALANEIKKLAKPLEISDRKRIMELGTIASNGDSKVGELLAEVFSKVGKAGAITIEEGKGIETEIKVVEGMQFDRGFLSPHFITNHEAVEVVLEESYILIYEDKLSSAGKLVPILEKLAGEKRSLLVIAEDVEGDALATLVVNKLKGILECCAVKAPGYGDRRKDMLEDIAILTGGKAIFKDLGIDLEKVSLGQLGRAKKVIVDSDNTTIVEGYGEKNAIERRVRLLRREIEKSDSDYDREKLQERIARLSGGIARINVGAATEAELKERKQKVEGAYHTLESAFEEGFVTGGGVVFIRIQEALDSLKPIGDEKFGVSAVRKALSAPLMQIAENGGYDGAIVAKKIKGGTADFGFDVEKGEFCNLQERGIIDSAKVARCALLNGASVASLLITANALVSDIPEEKEKKMPPPYPRY